MVRLLGSGAWGILFLGVAPAILGQQSPVDRLVKQLGDTEKAKVVPKPTSTAIGPHRLGETLEEWLAAEKFAYTGEACDAQKKKERARWSDFDHMMAENTLSPSGERESKRAGEECEQQMRSITRGDGELVVRGDFHDRNGRTYTWKFANHKLTTVSVRVPSEIGSHLEPDTHQEFEFLSEAFGAPSQTKMGSYQNGYGAKWECPEATWLMPDGATIFAWASIRDTDEGPRRGFNILFSEKSEAPPKPNNPYRP